MTRTGRKATYAGQASNHSSRLFTILCASIVAHFVRLLYAF